MVINLRITQHDPLHIQLSSDLAERRSFYSYDDIIAAVGSDNVLDTLSAVFAVGM